MFVDRFIKQHEAWIERQRRRVALTKTAFPTFDWEGKVVSYLGKLLRIRIMNHEVRIKINNQELWISPITGLEKDAKTILTGWLKREGEGYILKRLPELSLKMGTKYSRVTFRQQKSRWGSCSGRGNVSFNWRLIHFKPAVIDYVIMHELAHIKHHDHSRDFWGVVEQYCGNYKEHVRFLKRQVLELI